MDRKGANDVLKEMKRRYPSKYPPNMDADTAKATVDDLMRNFGRYETTDVIAGLAVWSDSNKFAPLMSEWELEVQKARKKFTPISQEEFDKPTTWSNYTEDSDGCGYALNSKTHEFDCIWKPWWHKSKMATLKEHGVISYES